MASVPVLTGIERTFLADEIIVTKTDKAGKITYANDVFITISGYEEEELLGKPHNMIRHPHMPGVIFKYLWRTIESGSEIFAYVVNLSKNGDHYWVFAHVTPNFDEHGNIIGYHSNRRVPRVQAVAIIKPIYERLLAEERRHTDRKSGLVSSERMLSELIKSAGFDAYDRFILSL